MKERTYVDDIDRSVYDIKDKENDAYKVKAGLTPEIVEKISKEKNDPAWMQQFRLQSLQIYNSLQVPNWGPDIEDLDMDNIVTYVRPKSKMSAKWSEVPKDIKDTFERLGIPQAEQKSLAGVGVAFYLMLALRTFLRDQGWFDERNIAIPNLAELLDLVALGTVADVVPLDVNNRILTWQGMSRIRAGKCRPGIKALLEVANRDAQKLAASDLGFALGPRLNAAGRLDDMSVGVALLLCDNIGEARVLANELDALNQTRKEIEQGMQIEALTLCEKLERSRDTLPGGLAMYHPEWHQGVVGILASRIKERFHRPVIAFAPAGDGTLKGSGRSIQGLHMRDALERLDTLYPGMMLKFGGHAMAAGLSLEEDKFKLFQQRFGELVTEWLDPSLLQGEVVSDGPLSPAEMTMEVAQLLRDAGPWGQMFPEPLFDGHFRLLQQRLVGERHLKVMVEPVGGGPLLDGIAFNVDTALWPDNGVREVQLAYKLDINEFRGNRSLQIIIDSIWPI